MVQRTVCQRLPSLEVNNGRFGRSCTTNDPFRPYRHHFITLVALMLDTGLPCFRGHTLEQLNARLKPDSSEVEAARYMHEVINRCANSLRTFLYDYIQYQQNSIPY